MRSTSLLTLLVVCVITYSQKTITTYYPEEKDSSGAVLRKPVKEEFTGIIKNNDTIKSGSYKLYYQFDPQLNLEGIFKNNLKHGTFISYYPTGNKKWVRNYNMDFLIGKEEIYNQRGEIEFTGTYTQSKKGKDILTTYKQTDRNGLLSVTATYINDTLHGEFHQWKDDNLVSTYTFNKGIKEGAFRIYNQQNGKIQNKGEYLHDLIVDTLFTYYPSGTLHSYLIFDKDLPNGDFKEFYEDGSLKRKATYKHDTIVGADSIFYENGQLHEVTHYANGARNGLHQTFHSNGQLKLQKHFLNDKENGEVVEYDSLGNLLKKSHYITGHVHGVANIYYPSGQMKAVLHFIKDRKSGTHTFYFENGETEKLEHFDNLGRITLEESYYATSVLKQKIEYQYKNDRLLNQITNKYSVEYNYSTNGILTNKTHKIDGILHGESIDYYEDGSTKAIVNYAFGKKSGVSTYYFENGKISKTETYQSNLLNGITKVYNEKSKLVEVAHFRNSRLHGPYELYNEKGKLIEEGNYRKGLRDGKWTIYNSKGKFDHYENYKMGKL